MKIDQASELNPAVCIAPRVIMAGNATYTGTGVAGAGYESVTYFILTGVLTDADYVCTVYEDTDVAFGTETKVADANLSGQVNDFALDLDDDTAVVKVGYIGIKPYTRLKIVQSNATTGGYICACAVQGNPRIAPTPSTVQV